jgi:bacterioferritin
MGSGMHELDVNATVKILDSILQQELAGVVRYTHYALMVTGPNRIPIVGFMKQQANESLLHAQQVGEILTGLEGHPSVNVAPIEETHEHSVQSLLQESLNHEVAAVVLYRELLECVADKSIYLEEFARTMIGQEEVHQMELRKMLRDFK